MCWVSGIGISSRTKRRIEGGTKKVLLVYFRENFRQRIPVIIHGVERFIFWRTIFGVEYVCVIDYWTVEVMEHIRGNVRNVPCEGNAAISWCCVEGV